MELTIVIPTFREKENLEALIPSIEDAFRCVESNFQILIVDDYSGDGTEELTETMCRRYGNVKILVKKGKNDIASAWQDGFSMAEGRYIACMDGDFSHDPEYLVKMYNEIKNRDCDIVIGSRYLEGFCRDFKGKGFLPRVTSACGQHLGRFLSGLKQRDISHSFRIFKREVFHKIKNSLFFKGNSYLVEFLYLAVKNNFSVCEIPIIYKKRMHGRTKLKIFKEGIRYVFSLIRIRLKKR